MSRTLASSPPGDPEKPANSVFVPPPVQRLSRSFAGFSAPPSKPQSPSDRASILPSQPSLSPLPGPNRAPGAADSPYPPPGACKPSNIFPRLHRLEISDDMGSNHEKSPLLELKLSSTSFLDAVATDTDSDEPLYSVETVGSSTTVWRSDPWDRSAKIADIRWPKDLPLKGKGRDPTQVATIQMGELRWRETTSLLKYSGLGRCGIHRCLYSAQLLTLFPVPARAGSTYSIIHTLSSGSEREVYTWYVCTSRYPHGLTNLPQCTTQTCKGAIASLESFNNPDTPPTLKVFETLGSFHQSVPRLDHAGISLFLLDHLFVTALLLVTEPDDWMTLARNPTSLDSQSADVPLSFKTASTTRASARQWRKVMYGEPMYPSLKTPAFDKGIVNGGEDADVLDVSEPPQLSTSVRQWRKIVYGEPLYPSLRPQLADRLDLPPRPSTATSFSSESAYSPPTPSPSTGSYDAPSLFDDTNKVTPRNGTETRPASSPLALSSGTLSPVPSSECIPSAFPISVPPGPRRELPSPPSSYHPPPAVQPWLHRSNSSPKLSCSTQPPIPSVDNQDDPTNQSLLTRISSGWNVRQLPTPPLRESPIQSPQSLARPAEAKRFSQTHQRSLPPTPASVTRSQSATEQHHGHSQSQVVASQSQPMSAEVRPSTAQPGSSMAIQNDGAARGRRPRLEKDPHELIGWMRNIARAHRRRAVDGEDEDQVPGPYVPMYEPPPPAYNAIDFSTPPQARSPPEDAQS